MAHSPIRVYSSQFRIADELSERRVTISPGEADKEIHIGETRDVVLHWIRQPTSGSITIKFQTNEQRGVDPTAFDTVDNGTITFSATPNNKKIIRDVWSSHMQVSETALGGAAEFIVESITFVSRS